MGDSRIILPVIVGILILGTLGLSQQVFAGVDPTLYSVTGNEFDIDPQLRSINPNDNSTLSQITITLAGKTIKAGTGLATNPLTGELYGILNVEEHPGRELVKINQTTGVATSIGDTGRFFAGIAFDETGTLYGVTGAREDENDGKRESLFTISLSNAVVTYVCGLGTSFPDESFAFNPNDNLFYHMSGFLSEPFEKFDGSEFDCSTQVISRTLPITYSRSHGLTWWPSEQVFLRSGSTELYSAPPNTTTPTEIGSATIESLVLAVDGQTETLYGFDPDDAAAPQGGGFLEVDKSDANIISSIPVFFGNDKVLDISGMAQDSSGTIWATLNPGDGRWALTTLDIQTNAGVNVTATQVGIEIPFHLSDLAFDNHNNLYAITDSEDDEVNTVVVVNGINHHTVWDKSVYLINTTNAHLTYVCTVPNGGSFGQALGFNPNDGMLYHEAGDNDPGPGFGVNGLTVFEKFDPNAFNCDIRTIVPIIAGGIPNPDLGTTPEEPLAMTFWEAGNVFLLNEFETYLWNVTASGVSNFVGTLDHQAKGLAFVGQADLPDSDGDGIPDGSDNCPSDSNFNQLNMDDDGTGDACDLENRITSDVTLTQSTTSLGDVIVQGGAVLTVNGGVNLDIDFTTNNLFVTSGSGVLVKAGASIS